MPGRRLRAGPQPYPRVAHRFAGHLHKSSTQSCTDGGHAGCPVSGQPGPAGAGRSGRSSPAWSRYALVEVRTEHGEQGGHGAGRCARHYATRFPGEVTSQLSRPARSRRRCRSAKPDHCCVRRQVAAVHGGGRGRSPSEVRSAGAGHVTMHYRQPGVVVRATKDVPGQCAQFPALTASGRAGGPCRTR